MPYFFGFRQVRLKTTSGIIRSPGGAVLCGPYPTREQADANGAQSQAWDAALSCVFFSESKEKAEQIIERETPTS